MVITIQPSIIDNFNLLIIEYVLCPQLSQTKFNKDLSNLEHQIGQLQTFARNKDLEIEVSKIELVVPDFAETIYEGRSKASLALL